MNPQLTSDLAIVRARELQHTTDRHQELLARREPLAASGPHRPAALRAAIGFTLVAAGLRLLADGS